VAADDLSHCVTAECNASAQQALAFLADGIAVGRWALGCFNTVARGDGLFSGTSLFDGQELFARPLADAARMLVEYHVGTAPDRLAPRIVAKVVPGPQVGRGAGACLVSLIAWRDAAMTDERWARLKATHEAEIWLVKLQLERATR
jgi:hypothetical protein